MLASHVAVLLLQATPLFEPSVYRLMTCTGNLLRFLVCARVVVSRSTDFVVRIASVSFHKLTWIELLLQLPPKDLHVGPSSCWERATYPDDITSLDANSNFIPKSGALILVAIPFPRKRNGFVDRKVYAIHRHFAGLSPVTAKPIFPPNLPNKQRRVREQRAECGSIIIQV